MQEETKAKKEKNTVKFSIKYRVLLLVLGTIAIMAALILAYIIPMAKKIQKSSVENSMLELARLGARSIDIEYKSKQNVSTQDLEELLKDVQIEGISSCYTYVVNTDNIQVYHKRPGKTGTLVINEIIKQLNADIKNNKSYQHSAIISYVDENGISKYAAYAVSDTTKWVTVVAGYEKDAMQNINMIQTNSIAVLVVLVIVIMVIGYVLSLKITKPIATMTDTIKDIAAFNFTKSDKLSMLQHRSDETGEMARQIFNMEENLQQIVTSIKEMSVQMSQNAVNLVKVTETINQASEDNSATSEELAASMEETSATATTVDSNIGSILSNTEVIDKESQNGVAMANEINSRAMNMNRNAVDSSNKTMDIYNDVKVKTKQAIEQSKAVDKVNVLAAAIQEIADQTSLLSLNASIEAARAGEAGKGFAVVAGEIGQLASQSTSTVTSIMKIVNEVNAAVQNMEICMSETLEFLETEVIADYKNFIDVSEQYKLDAENVDISMNKIYEMANALKKSSEEIVSSVSGITETIGQAAIAVNDVAEKTMQVVTLSDDVMKVVNVTNEDSATLSKIADKFIL
mgnify:FL=1